MVTRVKQGCILMILFPRLGAAEISTLWHFRRPLQVQTLINVVFSQTIRDLNDLPDSLNSSAEVSDDHFSCMG